MGTIGKLTKLKSAMKRWPSLTKHHQNKTDKNLMMISSEGGNDDDQLRAVYVGKSQRRYLLSSDIIHHPLFQELVVRSNEFLGSDHNNNNNNNIDGEAIVVACEVVLFEHLLWMLKNCGNVSCAHGDDDRVRSMEELVEFYTYY